MSVKGRVLKNLKLQRQQYLERLPATVACLGELAHALSRGDLDPERAQALSQQLHRIAGSAGMFGLNELGIEAGRLQRSVETLHQLDGPQREALAREVLCLTDRWLASTEYFSESVGRLWTPSQSLMPTIWFLTNAPNQDSNLLRSLRQYGFDVQCLIGLDRVGETLDAAADAQGVLILDAERVQLTHELVAHLQRADITLVYLSPRDDFVSRLEASQLGAAAFSARPLDLVKLVEQLDALLGEQEEEAYRILIVDDDNLLASHYQHALMEAGMQVEVETEPLKLMARLEEVRPDLLLLDINMPQYSGIDLVKAVRYYEEWTGLPIVYLSAELNPDKQLYALGQGGDHFITKPASDQYLVSVIRVRAERMRRLANLHAHDGLTGLLNHVHTKEALSTECLRAARENSVFSVVMLDIDHFKQVNDTYGHRCGDTVIRALAHLLKTRLRGSDQVGRYGGEEFLAILPGCHREGAERQCNWLREAFAAIEFSHEGNPFSCTLSAGVACSDAFNVLHPDQILECADRTLYMAKDAGRNQVRSWHGSLLISSDAYPDPVT